MADMSVVDFMPSNYINEVIENSETTAVIRSNISSPTDINSWVDEFGFLSQTQWNAISSKPAEKITCLKKFTCHHSGFKKIDGDKNKKGVSQNFGCHATITAKIKLNTLATGKEDAYVKKGLVGIIVIDKVHNHSLQTGDTLQFLSADQDLQIKFYEYFKSGMGIAEACRYHEGLLERTGHSSEGMLASGRTIPSKTTVRDWHDQWLENLDQQSSASLSDLQTDTSHSENISFTSVWIKEEPTEEVAENEGEEEENEEYTNEIFPVPDIFTVVKEEVTIDDTESKQCQLESQQLESSVSFKDKSAPKALLCRKPDQENMENCEFDTSSKSHKNLKKFECDVCYKGFKSHDGLARHKFVHGGIRRYECDMCNKSFNSSSNLAGHKLVHSNIKEHKCHTCDKGFKTFRALKVHKLIHGSDKKYKCDICKKAFKLPSTLSQHKYSHSNVRRYQCGICNKLFPYLHLLSRHNLVHNGIKKHHCDICNKAFRRRYEVTRHKTVHSGVKAVKKYQCDICFKMFTHTSSLSVHKISHSGAKNYQCDICNNTFTTARNLIRHKDIHNGPKQYQCDICNKAFNWSTGLSVHKLTHTGIKYQCDICNRILSNASNLTRHRLAKHTNIKKKCTDNITNIKKKCTVNITNIKKCTDDIVVYITANF